MPKIEIVPSDDKTELTLVIDEVSVKANALQVDALIAGLVATRAQLLPAVPSDPPLGQRVPTTVDPQYWTNVDPENGMTTLLFRHPGLGWLVFALPIAERERLTNYLELQSKAAAAADAGPPGQAIH